MILTRLFLNPSSRDVQRALGDGHALHLRVMSMFAESMGDSPRAKLGVLHRLERVEREGVLMLLVQSRDAPEPGRLPAGFLDPRVAGDAVASTDLASVLAALLPGARLRFRLRANPTRCIDTKSGPDGRRRNGKRVPVRGDDGRATWLLTRLEAHGFCLLAPFAQRPEGVQVGVVASQRRSHDAWVFDGLVEVVDSEKARAALVGGVGPAKAYGFGLLSLARP